jgi:hypothetical protein
MQVNPRDHEVHADHSSCCRVLADHSIGSWSACRGGILGQNPDRNLKSFPPCYSQTPQLSDCTPHLQFSWT